jgi:hypothetical protein
MSYALAGLAVVVAAAGYHGVTEHHWHLHYFWRYVRPGIVIPETRHDTRWHAMSHRARYAVNAAMAAAALGLGLAWQLAPAATTITVIIAIAAGAAALGARALSRVLGERHHPARYDEEN